MHSKLVGILNCVQTKIRLAPKKSPIFALSYTLYVLIFDFFILCEKNRAEDIILLPLVATVKVSKDRKVGSMWKSFPH